MIVGGILAQQFYAGDRVVRKGTKDQSLFFVLSGEFFTLDQHQVTYTTGAVLGGPQFLHNDAWDFDLIAKSDDCVICKYTTAQFQKLKQEYPLGAIRLTNRVYRQMTYDLIYQKKNDIEYYHTHLKATMEGLKLKDQDLMVDMRVGDHVQIQNLFKANTERNIEIETKERKLKQVMEQQKEDMRKGRLDGL